MTKLRARRKGGYCHKCSLITMDVFAQAVAQRREERRLGRDKSTEDDLDDLDLDELDEIEEEAVEVEDEVAEEDDVEDEDPDEAPKSRKRSRKAKTDKAPSKKKTTADAPKKVGIGTKEVADLAGVESRALRQFLRASGYQPREEREGRYTWPNANDPEVKEIVKRVKGGAVERMNKEKLSELKDRKGSKSAKKVTSAKRSRSSK